MTIYLKKHERGRDKTSIRNVKGASTPKIVRRKKKQLAALRRKMSD